MAQFLLSQADVLLQALGHNHNHSALDLGATARLFAGGMHGGGEKGGAVRKRSHANLLLQDGALSETCFNIHGL